MQGIKARIAAIQSGAIRSRLAITLRILLLPVSWIYQLITLVRNALYRMRVLRVRTLPGKVVSIGNLTTGGAGKTPVVVMLAEMFQSAHRKFAILTRGYGAAYEHSEIVFNSSRVERDAIDWLADEVVMLAEKLPFCWFGVGRDRYRNGSNLNRRQGVELFLLDDGFQHRRLNRDVEIVVIDASRPFGNGSLFPAGNLREGPRSLRRADLVLLSRCELAGEHDLTALQTRLERYVGSGSVFKLRTELISLRDLATGLQVSLEDAARRKFWLFSGVGNPAGFRKLIRNAGLSCAGETIYADHHRYCEGDVRDLLERIGAEGRDALMTTEKDAVKLPSRMFKEEECLIAQISFAFVEREDIFRDKIREVIGAPL